MSKIYLVEDDEYIIRVYERAFRLSGHDIEIHTEGEEALKTLLGMASLPDAIIVDIGLPKLSGGELIRTISADVRFTKTPIVVLTNSFDEKSEKELLDAGADMYLLKIQHEPKDVVGQTEALIKRFEEMYNG